MKAIDTILQFSDWDLFNIAVDLIILSKHQALFGDKEAALLIFYFLGKNFI
ncbi:MAG: hypothetical protein ACJA0T_001209 [Colwellia sp.]|jgi:hypothetical protein